MRTIVPIVVALLLAGCAAGGGSPSTPTPSEAGQTLAIPTVTPPSVSPTLHVDRPPDGQMRISGVFGFDSIEGGCSYVQTDATTRYEVLYPAGWKVDGNELRKPDGEVAARAGDSLTLLGEIATDMASTCQIGPIFRATEVVTIDQ